jgi:hypothetical protein
MKSRSRVTSNLHIAAAVVLLSLLLLPGVVTASSQHQPSASASLKSLALQLSDIKRVYGSGLMAASNGSIRKSADITCASTPTIEFANGFGTSNGGPAKNGLLSISAVLYQYKTSAGPLCNFKYDLLQRKTLGATLGVVTKLSGVGDQAVLIRLDPVKGIPGPPVYALDARFIRGRYLELIIVQMNRKVRPADVTSLAKAVDSRIKHGG